MRTLFSLRFALLFCLLICGVSHAGDLKARKPQAKRYDLNTVRPSTINRRPKSSLNPLLKTKRLGSAVIQSIMSRIRQGEMISHIDTITMAYPQTAKIKRHSDIVSTGSENI